MGNASSETVARSQHRRLVRGDPGSARPILASTSMEPGTKIQIEQPGYRNHQELTEMTRFGGGGVSCGSPSISSQLSNVNGVF